MGSESNRITRFGWSLGQGVKVKPVTRLIIIHYRHIDDNVQKGLIDAPNTHRIGWAHAPGVVPNEKGIELTISKPPTRALQL